MPIVTRSQANAKRGPSKVPIKERFQKFVQKAGPDECWEWLGARDKKGYGRFGAPKGEAPLLSHRVAFEMAFGVIPEGLQILHSCDNKGCVNPSHLSAGTAKQNAREAWQRGLMRHNKLSAADVEAIRRSGAKPRVLAAQYNVTSEHIWKLRTGRKGDCVLLIGKGELSCPSAPR